MSGLASARDDVVCLNLDFGSYEFEVAECRELIRFLEGRGKKSERDPPDDVVAAPMHGLRHGRTTS